MKVKVFLSFFLLALFFVSIADAETIERNDRYSRKADKQLKSQFPGGSDAGSGGGMAGAPQAPGGITSPGSGNTPPPFGDGQGDVPGISNPTGMGRPGDKIVTPDNMGEHSVSGSYGNLYGGINPARDPRQGGGRGDFTFLATTKSQMNNVMYVYNPPQSAARDNAEAMVVDSDSNGATIYYFYKDSAGTVHVESVSVPNETGSGTNSIDGFGDKGDQQPLSEEEKEKIRKAKMAEAYEFVKNSPAVHNDGGVVDPVRNQANGDRSSSGSGKSSGQVKAAVAAKGKHAQKPGSVLTGGGRIDTDNSGTSQFKPPQGFHVIDPKEQQDAAASGAGSTQ
ncbi:MAG: hypothetical protein OQK67_06505 [Chlorobium sp.]|nr:hypothetical protein [Chlorobium sp.]MCW8815373.1 hypothetical protein [Chlorobium sp.]MCW8818849.1 hypothetical protein [Ignavibacteriaceae bacterium]